MELGSGKTRLLRRGEMYRMMERYVGSGQTQAAFCASEGLKVGTFQYWWRRYRSEEESLGGGGFVALEPERHACWEVELHYGSVRLCLGAASVSYVAELLRQLSGGC